MPSGMILVDDPNCSEVLYKFSPWSLTQLAINEIGIYSRLYSEGTDTQNNIVQLKAIGSTSQHLVRQMERSPFGSLDRFLYKNHQGQCQLSSKEIRTLLIPIVQALTQMHALNIIHRDLKAENILVFPKNVNLQSTSSIQLKLSDFDRAVYLEKDASLTNPVGSLLHMAPELLAWQAYTHKVDIYAFAMLLFELSHGGRQPHSNIGTGMPDSLPRKEFAEKVVNDNLRPLWQHPDECLKQLAQDCWQADPAKRPEFSEILQRLSPNPVSAAAIKTEAAPFFPALGMGAHIGKVRTTMEDAAVVLSTPQGTIAAVFDGLRDARSSAFAACQLPLLVQQALGENPEAIEAALRRSFAHTEESLKTLHPPIESGTTATLALLRQNTLWLAWLGDSPAWLIAASSGRAPLDEVIELCTPHHPCRQEEAERIEACGGRIAREFIWLDNGETMPSGPLRVYFPKENTASGIALSRALGLFAFKPAIGNEIQMTCHPLQAKERFLLLASDGVLGLLDRQAVLDRLNAATSAQQAADALIAEVLKRGAPDNACLVLLDLHLYNAF